MDQFKNFLPLIVFALAYVFGDIYIATAALMIAVAAQVGLYLLLKQPLSMELKVTFWVGMVMGSLTLFFQNDLFIKWKPTIVNWAMALGLLATHLFGRSYAMEMLLGRQIKAPKTIWRNINLGWALGFGFAGALNLVVAYNYSTDFWVTYKIFGGMALTIAYMVVTMVYLYRAGLLDDLEENSAQGAINNPGNPGAAPGAKPDG